MTALLEHDRSLILNRRSAERFLEMIAPSVDDPQKPMPGEPADDRPQHRSSHTFVVADDVAGRNDPTLSKTLTGSLDQHFAELERMNIRHRAGVFLELSAADCIVLDSLALKDHEISNDGLPRRAFPIEPSLTIQFGWGPGPDHLPLMQWAWLLSGAPIAKDRNTLAGRLAPAAVTTRKTVLVRLPGTFARRSNPVLVRGGGLLATQGQTTKRYPADVLAQGLGAAA